MMKRMFLALWPDETVRRNCAALARTLSSGGGQRMRPANLHVTLVFLGNVEAEREALVRSALSAVTMPSIELRFDRVSYWAKPGILCLTAGEPNADLVTLVERLSAIAKSLAIPCDDRPYQAHVTLVKKVKANVVPEFAPVVWKSRSICLVESCRTEQGVDYRIVEQWPHPALLPPSGG